MKKIPLTDSEWKIMRLLWAEAPRTMPRIVAELREETGWSKHTVISFLKRMIEKKAVSVKEASPAREYFPLISEEQAVRTETRSMLDKLYGGSVSLMVSGLVERGEIGDEEIQELLSILRGGDGDK